MPLPLPWKSALSCSLTNAGVSSVTAMLEEGMTPTDMLHRVLDGLGYQELDALPARFYCGCDHERAARVVLALGEKELREMIAAGEGAEAYCHFCGKRHYFAPDELRELLGQ